jgi:phenylacetic acid degradation operon negative regulatory protein
MTSDETTAAPPSSPRFAAGSARSLLLTLFGEFVFPADTRTWTSTLLQAFAGLGVGDKAARQALMRAAADGWVEGEREGRRTAWSLTPHARRMIEEGSRRVSSLREVASEWSGQWVVLHIALTDAQRTERQRLYRALGWLGFGSPAVGLWVCPHEVRAAAVRSKLEQLELADQAIAFQGRALDFGMAERDWVERAWDLAGIAAAYEELMARFGAMRPRGEQAAFLAHVELVNALQRLPSADPGLPAALLPRDWPALRASQRLNEIRTRWRDAAHAHWQKLAAAS